ncbi:MAG: hypothetical protein GWN47_02790 [Woeseiaceae bacterium]|nr:hypothetical protein [Woeseiaceae bacterium]
MERMKWTALLLVPVSLLAGGCAVKEVITAEETELVVAEAPPDESLLLDIGIIEFSAGIPNDNDPVKTRVYEEIRNAETRYLPYHLKKTLQGTGHWGAVRVIPNRSAFTDVVISGAIEKSDGEYIEVEVSVDDASGRHWYSKKYETQTGISSYSQNRDRRLDPYQKVFNDIANDLRAYVDQLPGEDISRIRQVSELQFFADMSPQSFGEHLASDEEGVTTVSRLPANNDPAVARLRKIRERDRLVVDTLNEHYANFYYGIAIPYHSWRKSSREESINFRQVKRSAAMQSLIGVAVLAGSLAYDTSDNSYTKQRMKQSLQGMAIQEGFGSIMKGIQRRGEATMHVEAIKELSESFGAEAAPMVVTVEGETRRLTGTAAAQYESWRRLLRQIYEAETGFVETDESAAPVRVPEPTG